MDVRDVVVRDVVVRDVVLAESIPLERLEAEITQLAGNLAAAEYRWMALIAEYDQRAGYLQWGSRSCAHWLNWHCGLDMRAARERVRVARTLATLPVTATAFGAGTLSYSKVRALTRIATPANEASLVMIAQHGTAVHVEKTVRAYRKVLTQVDEPDVAKLRHASRYLRYDWDDDGMLNGTFKMTPEVGAVFLKAIELMRGLIPADEHGPAGPPTRNGGDRYQIVIHADERVLAADGDPTSAGMCELDDGPALDPETVRRLACDASIVIIGTDGERRVLTAGHKAPAIPPATRRAIRRRDRGCRFPECDARVFTWNIRTDQRGQVLAIRPNGNVLREPPPHPPADPQTIERDNTTNSTTIDPDTCIPRWYGEKLDLDHIITGLLCIDHPELVLGNRMN